MTIVALDPGQTTGVAVIPNEGLPWNIVAMQLTGAHHSTLLELLVSHKPSVVICETFQNRGQDSAVLASVEYIGVVKLYLQLSKATGVWQSSSTGKQFWDDERLQQYGLYIKGLPHARDAIRHYAYWRAFKEQDKAIFMTGRKGAIRTG